MCPPAAIVPLLSAVASIGGAIMQYNSQAEAAQAQAIAANNAYKINQETLALQAEQIKDQHEQEMSERAKIALKEKAMMRVAAGESGLAGVSIDRSLNESEFNAGQDIAMLNKNKSDQLKQNNLQLQGAYAQAKQRHASIVQPSLIGTGLAIAGYGLEGYSRYDTIKSGSKQKMYAGAGGGGNG